MYTGLFTAGLKIGVPWARLVTMRRNELLMLVRSTMPAEGTGGSTGVRDATPEDIDRLFA